MAENGMAKLVHVASFWRRNASFYPKLPKYWAIQSFRGTKYNYPMLDQSLRHLKCAVLYMYDDAIFDDSH